MDPVSNGNLLKNPQNNVLNPKRHRGVAAVRPPPPAVFFFPPFTQNIFMQLIPEMLDLLKLFVADVPMSTLKYGSENV